MRLSSFSRESEEPTGLTGNPARDLAGSFKSSLSWYMEGRGAVPLPANPPRYQ